MIIHRTPEGPTPNVVAMAGSAMLRDESSETSRAPRAASTTGAGIARVYSAPALRQLLASGRRSSRLAVGEEVAEGGGRRRKRQLVPRNVRGRDPLHPIVLVADGDRAAGDARAIDDDDDRRGRVRVDADEAAQFDGEARLLVRLADRRRVHRLAPVDVPSGERPLAVRGMDRPPREQDAPLVRGDSAGDDLLSEVVDKVAPGAHHLALALRRNGPALETSPTEGAELDAIGGEVRTRAGIGHRRRVYHALEGAPEGARP